MREVGPFLKSAHILQCNQISMQATDSDWSPYPPTGTGPGNYYSMSQWLK